MAASEGQLNGYRDFRVRLDVNYSGVQSGNSSRFDWSVTIVDAANWGSFVNDAVNDWSVSIGGVGYSGKFGYPGGTRVVASGQTWHGHDANGYRGGFASSAWMSVQHDNIGAGGSGEAWVDAPRIPKVPAAPSMFPLDEITSSSMRARFSGNDDGGSGIIRWELQHADNAAFTAATLVTSSGTSTITGLPPSKTRYARARGVNAIGNGSWSSTVNAKTLAALYFLDPDNPGAAPEPVTLYAWTGSAYELVDLLIDPELDGTYTYPVA